MITAKLRWSFAGAVAGMDCVQVHEGRDPHKWHDNFLCYRQPVADLVTITKIRTVKPQAVWTMSGVASLP
ncbi:hypothetical protein [Antarctobacter jejuensis]|uniref:hypothetical protein n=1 Tax=Antarctobacter jejuensis TaxID=1439938 RepID=UPI003FCFC452